MATTDDLSKRFREHSESMADSPLYRQFGLIIAERPHLAALLTANPHLERRLPVLLYAAIHYLVLFHPDDQLAAWYPTVTDTPRTDDPTAALERFCDDHAEQLRISIATRTVQTNEVARCSFLRYGLWQASQLLDDNPDTVSMVDVGASAGLNLCIDQYRVDYNPGGPSGPADSPVAIHCQTVEGFRTPPQVRIAGRIGLEYSPINLDDPDDARWLLACVWPDQPERFHRIEAAVEIAREVRPSVVAGDAVDGLAGVVAEARPSATPVVTNSWVLNYLSVEQRKAFVHELDRLGAEAPLAWLWAESPFMTPGLPWPVELQGGEATELRVAATQLMVSVWTDGIRHDHHIATCHPHGRRLTPTQAT